MTTRKVDITYFNYCGLGESVRLWAAAAGVPFNDNELTKAQWPKVKADASKTPFGQLPVLQSGGFQLAQAVAILQYIADKARKGSVSAEERATTLMYALFVADIQVAMFASEDAPDQKERERKIAHDLLPRLERLNAHVARSTTGWLVGDSISFADTAAFEVVSATLRKFPHLQPSVDKLTSLRALMERVRRNELVAAYLARPEVVKRWAPYT